MTDDKKKQTAAEQEKKERARRIMAELIRLDAEQKYDERGRPVIDDD